MGLEREHDAETEKHNKKKRQLPVYSSLADKQLRVNLILETVVWLFNKSMIDIDFES